ncbi:Domain of Uncharacterised Function with PDB structure [Klebsiella pneumoniae]|uniref:DUF3850 domain-containing protein n=1 Tax=Klebsiella TaxID=570 RepID=UPI000E2D2707|nr:MULTISPECIES: DUF3850 domain-containing protein [Klebsiella]MBA2101787.1 hypothetical protein [Klebsiella pneumoniae subsp. pneumoniae]MBZ7569146.1 DUF3850 domain-containing protein [Klebsiella grimontii]MDQ5139204.1 DUF3850 domain-containing protein [Klebsiella pneumoniae]MDQ5325410.1 DUF3850 domain-containing protein [Klebsiella pneumoniae]SVP79803.1 Domain of Uncharacterised Function with PDB structure [Klebsiella pneumoniae]
MTNSQLIREPITHELKIFPEFFSAVCTGVKRAELRKNDRDYRVGDRLHLLETLRGSCHSTGEFINATITHIADVGEWMPGYVLLSVKRETVGSGPVATLDVQSGRADGHKFALAYSSVAHKLPDGVYFLYCQAQTTLGRDSLPAKQASLEYTSDIENLLEGALARVAELESELSEWTDCKHDGATYYDMSGRERCGRCGADI